MSLGTFSQKHEALTYRAFFAAKWGEFIRSNFASDDQVVSVFQVEISTARKWREGQHAPSGFAVGYAYQHFPEQAANALRGAA